MPKSSSGYSYRQMIRSSLTSPEFVEGASTAAIKQFIYKNYNVPRGYATWVDHVLKRMHNVGEVKKITTTDYILSKERSDSVKEESLNFKMGKKKQNGRSRLTISLKNTSQHHSPVVKKEKRNLRARSASPEQKVEKRSAKKPSTSVDPIIQSTADIEFPRSSRKRKRSGSKPVPDAKRRRVGSYVSVAAQKKQSSRKGSSSSRSTSRKSRSTLKKESSIRKSASKEKRNSKSVSGTEGGKSDTLNASGKETIASLSRSRSVSRRKSSSSRKGWKISKGQRSSSRRWSSVSRKGRSASRWMSSASSNTKKASRKRSGTSTNGRSTSRMPSKGKSVSSGDVSRPRSASKKQRIDSKKAWSDSGRQRSISGSVSSRKRSASGRSTSRRRSTSSRSVSMKKSASSGNTFRKRSASSRSASRKSTSSRSASRRRSTSSGSASRRRSTSSGSASRMRSASSQSTSRRRSASSRSASRKRSVSSRSISRKGSSSRRGSASSKGSISKRRRVALKKGRPKKAQKMARSASDRQGSIQSGHSSASVGQTSTSSRRRSASTRQRSAPQKSRKGRSVMRKQMGMESSSGYSLPKAESDAYKSVMMEKSKDMAPPRAIRKRQSSSLMFAKTVSKRRRNALTTFDTGDAATLGRRLSRNSSSSKGKRKRSSQKMDPEMMMHTVIKHQIKKRRRVRRVIAGPALEEEDAKEIYETPKRHSRRAAEVAKAKIRELYTSSAL